MVTALFTMHLEGKFIAISGNDTGSIDLVDVSFPPGSTIACRSTGCSSTGGTTILGLGRGCPSIGKVRIVLNGTNTSTSMVSIAPTSVFALINIGGSTGASTTPAPRDHAIVLDRASALWPESSLLVVYQYAFFSPFFSAYPFYSGTIVVRGLSVTHPSGGAIAAQS